MRPGVVVTGLTVGAMALVSLLAFQAEGAVKKSPAAAKPAPTASAAPSPTADPSPTAAAVPENSGTGLRLHP
jgi:hypothetical protein